MNKKLTAEQILEKIKENYTVEKFGYLGNWESEIDLNEIGLGRMKVVDKYGGEGEGETWFSVKHFIDHDVYIRIDGYYQSYNGVEFYEGYGVEVFPQEKTIVVYEPKK